MRSQDCLRRNLCIDIFHDVLHFLNVTISFASIIFANYLFRTSKRSEYERNAGVFNNVTMELQIPRGNTISFHVSNNVAKFKKCPIVMGDVFTCLSPRAIIFSVDPSRLYPG